MQPTPAGLHSHLEFSFKGNPHILNRATLVLFNPSSSLSYVEIKFQGKIAALQATLIDKLAALEKIEKSSLIKITDFASLAANLTAAQNQLSKITNHLKLNLDPKFVTLTAEDPISNTKFEGKILTEEVILSERLRNQSQ